MAKLSLATEQDAETITDFLLEMNTETGELLFDRAVGLKSVTQSFSENTYWFLFLDDQNQPFGICYCQSVHNYWRAGKRFYLGGFYIAPTHRGKGFFRQLNQQLRNWCASQGGVQIYAHIHKENDKSMKSFGSVGFKDKDYRLWVMQWDGNHGNDKTKQN